MRLLAGVLACAGALLLGSVSTPASGQSVVHLRTDCAGVSETCFTNTELLTEWLWNGGRSPEPSASDRVLVLAGPGNFDYFECAGSGIDRGYVTVIGAGRDITRFYANDRELIGPYCKGGITVQSCESLNFQDLSAYGSHFGVTWVDDGFATWSDVDMIGGGKDFLFPGVPIATGGCGLGGFSTLGWYDVPYSNPPLGSTHYLFGARSIARGQAEAFCNPGACFTCCGRKSVGFDAASPAEIWFYGGEITAISTVAAAYGDQLGVQLANGARMHVFGSAVRSVAGDSSATFGALNGVLVQPQGASQFHMHGGLISADASCPAGATCTQANLNAEGVVVPANKLGHLMGTSFEVKARGTGVARRLVGSIDDVEGPFIWHAASSPPLTSTTNTNAQDIFVDTAA
ncbi:MAG: hypothetical protein ACREI8_03810, partial [Myxococcota bacterium]